MLSNAKIRAYARVMDAGFRVIDEIEETYRVAVYIELVALYKWSIEKIDKRYVEQVTSALAET